ncbi:MAG: glycosyltransferase WbuB [Betaproteobacteria bacterium]|nr:glycosyltransferase WbuB [Betaproteobacteria bacterium]
MQNPMHVLFISDNFPPETNAGASRTFEHARRWVEAGHRVTVVAAAPNFPEGRIFKGYKNRLMQREVLDGIEVVRVWTYITANTGFFRRTVDQASFMISATVVSLFLARPHVVIATSPQFLQTLAGYAVSRLKRRPFIFELRDLWPDSIVAVGAMRESALIKLLRRLEYFIYRHAAKIVSVTDSFKAILEGNGIPAERIGVVPNGADLETYRPGEAPQALIERWGLQGKFVAAYVGTVGMAHGLSTLLDAAQRLRGRDDIRIVVVGTGAEKDELIAEAARRGLHNVIFVGGVPKADVAAYWRLCDVALVLLRDLPLFRHVIPSKMFEAMATGRAIILGVQGESATILERAQAGMVIPPENVDALVAAIQAMADDRERCRATGVSGRQFVEGHYDRDVLATKMLGIIEEVNREY